MRRFLLLLVLPLFLLAACNRMPDHARYIPKSAVSVVGLNLRSMGKKVAWSKLTGSDILKSLDSAMQGEGVPVRAEDMRESGVDLNNTLYVFFTPRSSTEAGYSSMPGATGILPLRDNAKWEGFLRKTFPQMQSLTASKGAKAAALNPELLALWTDKVALVGTVGKTPGQYVTLPDSTEEWQEGTADNTATLTKLQELLRLEKEEALPADARFTRLEKAGHDLTFWINYEQTMNQVGGTTGMAGMMMGRIWKNTALASGADFKDGRVDGEMLYYTSEELKDISQKMGQGRAPEALLERLPKDNLAALAGMDFPMETFRTLLEKMNLLGMANLGLSSQGLSLDDLLEAFTGEMAVSLRDFKVVSVPGDTTYQMPATSSPKADYVVALKIGKIEKLRKLLDFTIKRHLLQQIGTDTYGPYSDGSTPASGAVVMLNKDYLVAARSAEQAKAFLAGSGSGKLPEAANAVVGKGPYALYVDVQKMLAGIDPATLRTPQDLAALSESRRIFSHVAMGGGRFSGDHFEYNGALHLMNKEENALLQLLQYGSRMQKLWQQQKAQEAPLASDAELEASFQAIDSIEQAAEASAGPNPSW